MHKHICATSIPRSTFQSFLLQLSHQWPCEHTLSKISTTNLTLRGTLPSLLSTDLLTLTSAVLSPGDSPQPDCVERWNHCSYSVLRPTLCQVCSFIVASTQFGLGKSLFEHILDVCSTRGRFGHVWFAWSQWRFCIICRLVQALEAFNTKNNMTYNIARGNWPS